MAAGPQTARARRVIVTRPADEAASWVDALRQRGWPVLALPLIGIGAPRDPEALAALQRARAQWRTFDALMFVSAAAVQHFFADSAALAGTGGHTRFWAPGPGTARALGTALTAHGIDAARIDAPPATSPQFDSEHLWPVVASQMGAGKRLLVVRGASLDADGQAQGGIAGSGREWLMARCRERGAGVEACVAYARSVPAWSEAQRAQALAATGADSLWLFSSSEALSHLRSLLPGTDWSAARALCTHERIAQAARDTGFGQVVSSRPALDDVLRGLESQQGSFA